MKLKKHKSIKKSKYFYLSILLIMLSLSAILPAQSSTFPAGSTSGRTTMTGEVTGIDIPLIDLSIREPESNQEVAFSIQLLLLLTIISLAPSILILATCFLRFSIVYHKFHRRLF